MISSWTFTGSKAVGLDIIQAAFDGGIYVYTSLVDARERFADETNPLKHIILFSDAGDAEEQYEALKKDLPGLVDNAVEEILRLATPSCGLWRKVVADTELGGVAIPAGSMLMVRFSQKRRHRIMKSTSQMMGRSMCQVP